MSNVTFKTLDLNGVGKVKDFVAKTIDFPGDINLKIDKHVVDGKSVLGIFSLNLSKPVSMELICDEEQAIQKFEDAISCYIVK